MAFNKVMLFSPSLSPLLEFFCYAEFILMLLKLVSLCGRRVTRMRPMRTHHTSLDELRFLRGCLATFYF